MPSALELRDLLSRIPQADRSGTTGQMLARLIAERAAGEFDRSVTVQEQISEFNRKAFKALPGGQPRGTEFQLPQVDPAGEPHDLMTQIESLQRMSKGPSEPEPSGGPQNV